MHTLTTESSILTTYANLQLFISTLESIINSELPFSIKVKLVQSYNVALGYKQNLAKLQQDIFNQYATEVTNPETKVTERIITNDNPAYQEALAAFNLVNDTKIQLPIVVFDPDIFDEFKVAHSLELIQGMLIFQMLAVE